MSDTCLSLFKDLYATRPDDGRVFRSDQIQTTANQAGFATKLQTIHRDHDPASVAPLFAHDRCSTSACKSTREKCSLTDTE